MPLAASVVHVWELLIDETQRAEFELRYGPRGTWAALFARASGYAIGTYTEITP